MSLTIYLPTSIPAQESIGLAPSPSSVATHRVAVLDNGKANAGVVMERAASSLAQVGGAEVSLVTKKGPGGRSANAAIPCAPDIVERLLAESDMVITGAADCGSCTAYSVHDAIELERAGRPTVVVTTVKFRPIAETLAANFGLPDVRLLVLPHPIGGTDRVTLHEWADASVDALTALFRGTTRIAVIERPDAPRMAPITPDEATRTDATAVASALEELRTIVQADGGDLRLTGYDDESGTATVDLVLEDASCADCVMPADHLEPLILTALQAETPAVQRVTINDPRLT